MPTGLRQRCRRRFRPVPALRAAEGALHPAIIGPLLAGKRGVIVTRRVFDSIGDLGDPPFAHVKQIAQVALNVIRQKGVNNSTGHQIAPWFGPCRAPA